MQIFSLFSNENDIEEEHCEMELDIDKPYPETEENFRKEMMEEVNSIKHFLYKK